jgi:zinc finger-containing ubiquitin peptidase 1
VQGIKPKKESSNKTALELLFSAVESYFNDGCTDFNPKVRGTSLPPIYFQHPGLLSPASQSIDPHLTCIGHSMTIVGFEKQTDGTRNLIVFDPMFHDASNIIKLIGRTFVHKDPEDLLKAYRRGNKYLKKYNEFELLK